MDGAGPFYLATIVLQVVVGQMAGLLGIASLVMSVVGIVRLGRGMGSGRLLRQRHVA